MKLFPTKKQFAILGLCSVLPYASAMADTTINGLIAKLGQVAAA